MTFRNPIRRNRTRLSVEPLERRDLMATDTTYGPLPLNPGPAEIVLPGPVSPTPHSGSEADPFAHFGQGNITAAVINGVLVIRGDGGNNHFAIYSRLGDTYVIDPGFTKINGQYYIGGTLETEYLFLSGVTAGFDIDLGEGDDWLTIHAYRVPELSIRLGAGDDRLVLKGPVPASMMMTMVYHSYPVLSGPTGNFDMAAQPLQVDGDLFIDAGAGNDQLFPYANVSGDATVQMGMGDDSYIETPIELYPITQLVDPETGYYPPGLYVIGKLTATGELVIDLGPDQNVENIPDDWRTDQYLVEHIQIIPNVLEHYAGMVARGENTPGVAQIVTPADPYDIPVRFDAEGRLEIYFSFMPGFDRVIERLQARGVTLDAYSIMRGFARASITADDLKLFANLPGITNFFVQIHASPGYRSQIHPEWDYVRQGSAVADENPPPPVEGNIVGPDYVHPGRKSIIIRPILIPADPVWGPPQLGDLPTQSAGEFDSLLDSRYGKRSQEEQSPRVYGPEPAFRVW